MKKKKAVKPYKRTASTVRQEAFITEYIRQLGNKAQAARILEIPYPTVMQWMKMEDFRERLQMAEEQLYDELHASLFARAGQTSDMLGIFFMKRLKPELYDDNIRKAKYLKENGIADPDKTQRVIVLVSDELPKDVEPEPDGSS